MSLPPTPTFPLFSSPSFDPLCLLPAELSSDPASSPYFSFSKVFDQPGTVLYYMSSEASSDGNIASSQTGVVNVTDASLSRKGVFQALNWAFQAPQSTAQPTADAPLQALQYIDQTVDCGGSETSFPFITLLPPVLSGLQNLWGRGFYHLVLPMGVSYPASSPPLASGVV